MMRRRTVLGWLSAGLATGAAAQERFPSRAIKIVVPFPAGGGSDIMARTVAEPMRAVFGTPVIVENRPGASGNIGADYVRTAPADGYTLMLTAAPFAIAPALYRKLPFDPVRDFDPVTLVATVPLLIVTRADTPFRTLADVVAAARKGENTVSFASFGLGSPPHLVGEIINQVSGVKMLHVPYRGGQSAMIDIITGRTTVGILDAVSTAPQVLAGQLRALAITGPKRSSTLPDVPTLAEAGIPFETVGWHALFGPAGMPPAVLTRLNAVVNDILARPELKAAIETGGSMPIDPPTSVEGWRTRFAADVQAWGKAARDSGAQIE